MHSASSSRSLIEIVPGVSRELAEHRASTLSDLRYRLVFNIPDSRADPIRGRVTASFNVGKPGPIVFDFAQSAEMVGAVLVNGAPAPHEVRDEHIVLTDGVPVGPVTVEIEFMAGPIRSVPTCSRSRPAGSRWRRQSARVVGW